MPFSEALRCTLRHRIHTLELDNQARCFFEARAHFPLPPNTHLRRLLLHCPYGQTYRAARFFAALQRSAPNLDAMEVRFGARREFSADLAGKATLAMGQLCAFARDCRPLMSQLKASAKLCFVSEDDTMGQSQHERPLANNWPARLRRGLDELLVEETDKVNKTSNSSMDTNNMNINDLNTNNSLNMVKSLNNNFMEQEMHSQLHSAPKTNVEVNVAEIFGSPHSVHLADPFAHLHLELSEQADASFPLTAVVENDKDGFVY